MTAAYLKGPEARVVYDGVKKHHSCHGKVAFTSATLAMQAAGRRKKRSHYLCLFCGLWHVGATIPARDMATRKLEERAVLIRKEEKP